MEMKLNYNVTLADIPNAKQSSNQSRYGAYREALRSFLASGKEVAMIQIPGKGDELQRQKKRMQSAFSVAVKRTGHPVQAMSRGDKIYLVRKEDVDHVQ